MLQSDMLQPQETEAKAMTEREAGTREEWLNALFELLERENELTHD